MLVLDASPGVIQSFVRKGVKEGLQPMIQRLKVLANEKWKERPDRGLMLFVPQRFRQEAGFLGPTADGKPAAGAAVEQLRVLGNSATAFGDDLKKALETVLGKDKVR